jgi:hypothetical protein
MQDKPIESLEDLWPLQAALNAKAGFDTAGIGQALAAAEQAGTADVDGVRLKVGRALKNYIDALSSECGELHDCLSWKHWYREAREGRQYELQDIQNARVEAVDVRNLVRRVADDEQVVAEVMASGENDGARGDEGKAFHWRADQNWKWGEVSSQVAPVFV